MKELKSRKPSPGLRELVEEAVREYNKYRSPEAVAKIKSITKNKVEIIFKGSFYRTCGINDWIDDMTFVLRDRGLKARLRQIIEPEDPEEEWRIGVFEVEE